jgi:GT2 family glycosyltransferase
MPYQPLASVIIVSFNGEKQLAPCLEALKRTTYPNCEFIVVDNGSSDGTGEVAKSWNRVKLVRAERNLGYAGGNNLGLRSAKGDFHVLLNDDTEVEPGWLEPIADAVMTLPDWGILGCLLLYPGGKIVQHAGGIIEPNGLTQHCGAGEALPLGDLPLTRVAYVTGAAFVINRHMLGLLGGLDEAFFPGYFEETDMCWRAAEVGFATYVVPASRVVHHVSQTAQHVVGKRYLTLFHRNRWRFILKNFPRRDLVRAIRAEVRWLRGNRPSDHYIPLLRALVFVALRLPSILIARRRNRRHLWWVRSRLATHRWNPLEPRPSPLAAVAQP